MTIKYSLQDINSVAEQILKYSASKILLFNGDMGAGKTTLIKAIVKLLGSVDNISSPTYSIVNEYKIKEGSIFHFDLYRVEDEEELYNFGIEDYLNTEHRIFVEWPEVLIPLIQANTCSLNIELSTNDTRILTITE